MRTIITSLLALIASGSFAQESWTAQRCMQYAVEHNAQVRLSTLELDNYEVSKTGAIGQFLPSANANIGMQYNFGRAIDPETNGYTDVSTFYNGYSVHASLPVFDGFNRINALKAAKASVLMGRNAVREQQDQTALATLQAWVNTLYYGGTVAMAEEKREETELLLKQTQIMVEIGRKSAADLAQIEAQHAESEYEMTRQQNLQASALLELKRLMNMPIDSTLLLEETKDLTGNEDNGYQLTTGMATTQHPAVLQQYHTMQARLYEWRQARASLYPTLSLEAGLSTTYYHTLHKPSVSSFGSQFKNNMGEYIGATLSIPLFNRLQTITSIRRAKNNYLMARETYQDKVSEIEKLRKEAWQDMEAYKKQSRQMEKKVEADSMAYHLTRRQYEEGLSTAIDLHTTATNLLQSKATLLQCRLMTIVKETLVRYYQGEKIW